MIDSSRSEYRKHCNLQYADEEIYDEIVSFVHLARENLSESNKDDYRKVLSECLRMYIDVVRDTVKDNAIVDEVVKGCKYIKSIAKSIHEGLHSRAFRQLQNYLPRLSSSLFCVVPEGRYFYRMRICDKRKDLSRKDIFHVPLGSIRKIDTKRYSAPGYPCLYLANSLYACWEEMLRPDTEKTLTSCFTNKNDLKLVDLRVPSLAEFQGDSAKYMTLFPLILACSMPVFNNNDVFKPEYSIPQLMLEWVISNRRISGVLGIYYTSVNKNNDFFILESGEWDNIAIPVLNPLSSHKFCPKLEMMFQLTVPTCYEYEKLKGNIERISAPSFHNGDSSLDEYRSSIFYRMENLLKQKQFGPATSEDPV